MNQPTDDELGAVEQVLREMPLRRPSDALDERVRQACRRGAEGSPVQPRYPARWVLWVAFPAAAAFGIAIGLYLLGVLGRTPPAPAPHIVARPLPAPVADEPPATPELICLERTFVGEPTSCGVLRAAGDAPLLGRRRQLLRQVWVIDPHSDRQVMLSVPVEQVVLVRAEPF